MVQGRSKTQRSLVFRCRRVDGKYVAIAAIFYSKGVFKGRALGAAESETERVILFAGPQAPHRVLPTLQPLILPHRSLFLLLASFLPSLNISEVSFIFQIGASLFCFVLRNPAW